MDGSCDTYLASPADFFAGADDMIKEREPGIEISNALPNLLLLLVLNLSNTAIVISRLKEKLMKEDEVLRRFMTTKYKHQFPAISELLKGFLFTK